MTRTVRWALVAVVGFGLAWVALPSAVSGPPSPAGLRRDERIQAPARLDRDYPVRPVPFQSAGGAAGHRQSGSDVRRWPSLSRFVLKYLWFSGFAGTSSGSRSTTDSP